MACCSRLADWRTSTCYSGLLFRALLPCWFAVLLLGAVGGASINVATLLTVSVACDANAALTWPGVNWLFFVSLRFSG